MRSEGRRAAWSTKESERNYNPFSCAGNRSEAFIPRAPTSPTVEVERSDSRPASILASPSSPTLPIRSGPNRGTNDEVIEGTPRSPFKSIFGKSRKSDLEGQDEDPDEKTLDDSERLRRMLKRKIPVCDQFRAVFLGSWFNVLLPIVPAGLAVN